MEEDKIRILVDGENGVPARPSQAGRFGRRVGGGFWGSRVKNQPPHILQEINMLLVGSWPLSCKLSCRWFLREVAQKIGPRPLTWVEGGS